MFKNNIMLKYLLSGALLALGLFLPTTGKATHIIGGEIGYKSLMNDNYEIVLSVYRDCVNGAANAPFDNPAYLGVYNENGVLIADIAVPFAGDDTISTNLNDPCLVILEEVCVHTSTYRTTVNLPMIQGGYTLVYQRCCRNETILNIVNPVAAGATYQIKLTEEAMAQENNSPTFTQWPPIYVCSDLPLVFDHSASDMEDDSLVYSLITPLSGGTLSDPQPIPPSSPPYDTIVWLDPLYSNNNILGTGVPLEIDSQTGIMTAVPGTIGQFLVGVRVDEYDRTTGVLLSQTTRDFQYNINPCGQRTAAFFAPEAQCDNLEVIIENQSEYATNYEWVFDYPDGTMTSNTTDAMFSVTYPDTGTYTIQLIAEPNSACSDTTYRSIFIQNNSLSVDFALEEFDCDDTAVLSFSDLSFDFESPVVSWNWVITSPGGVPQFSTDQNPIFNVPVGVEISVALSATSQNGCTQTLSQDFTTGGNNPSEFIETTINACIGDEIGLNANSPQGLNYNFTWEPATELNGQENEINPIITVQQSGTYNVTITPAVGGCDIIRTVTVNAFPVPVLDFNTRLDCDGVTIDFTNLSTDANAYLWNFGDPTSTSDFSTEVNPSYTYPDLGTYTVSLIVPDSEVCTDTITKQITIDQINLVADFDVEYTSCSTDSVVVQFTDLSENTMNNTSGYNWVLTPGGTSSDQNPSFTFYQSETVNVEYTITTADGCSNSLIRSFDVYMIENSDQFPDSLIICNGSSEAIQPGGDPSLIYSWTPTTGLDDPTSPQPTFSPVSTTTYNVEITAIGIDTCTYSEEVVAFVTPPINLSVTGDGVTCMPQQTIIASSDVDVTFSWTNDMGTAVGTGETLTLDVSGSNDYSVTAEDQYGCTETVDFNLSGGPVNVTVPDTVSVCLGDELNVGVTNLDPNDNLTYTWTPASAFVAGTENDASPDVIETIGAQTLYVAIENQFGCTYADSVRVAVIDDNVNFSFNAEVQCDGATVEFTNTSTNAFAYIWNFGDGTTSEETSPTHTYPSAGNYTVTLSSIYDGPCIVDAVQEVMVMEAEVVVDFDFSIVECSQNQAVVAFFDLSTGNFPIVSWNWTFSNGASSMEQNPIINFDNNGTYLATLTVITSNDCEASLTKSVDIQLVDINLQDSITLCKGDETALNPGGNDTYTYQWTPAESLDDPTASNPIASPSETTTYIATVYTVGSDTCSVMDTVVVFVPEDINIDLGPDVTTCGEDVTITAMTDVPVAIEWTSAVDGNLGTASSITVNPFTVDTIIANVTDQYLCVDSDTIIITDQGVDITYPSSFSACELLETEICIDNQDSDDALNFTWQPTDYIVGANTGACVTVSMPTGMHTLTVDVTNQHNCSETATIEVNVVNFDVTVPDTVYVCPGIPEGINPDGDETYTYSWSPTTGLNATDIANPLFIGMESGIYTVTISDAAQGIPCETIEDVVVIVNPEVGLMTGGDTTLCEIATIPIFANTTVINPVVINWYEEGQASPFDQGEMIMVTPESGTNIYTAIAEDQATGCSDTMSVTVQVNILTEGIPADTVRVCPNVDVEINPNFNEFVTYEWDCTSQLDLTNPGNPIVNTNEDISCTVTITDPIGGCMLIENVYIMVYDEINPVAEPDTTICEFGTVDLTVSADIPAEFTWYDDALLTNNIGTGTQISVDPVGASTYYVLASDENGCTEMDSVTVNAFPIQASITSPFTICEPTDFTPLVVINTDPDQEIVTYNWAPVDAVDGSGATVNALLNIGLNNFSVGLTNDYGCTETLETAVTVIDLAGSLNINAVPDTILHGNSSVITVSGCDDCDDYEWTWPNGSLDTDGNPQVTVTPEVSGSTNVEYEVLVSEDICTQELTATIYVINAICDDDHIFLPNAFTPNNDGENDVLSVKTFFADDILEMELIIYNRWGEEVFHTTDVHSGWDGTYKDELLEPDVYGYYLRILCPDEEEFIEQGNITILR